MASGAILAGGYFFSLPVFFGIFSYNGIDEWECWASNDSTIYSPWLGSETDRPDSYHNVRDNFDVVCHWGLWNFIIASFFGLCAFLGKCNREEGCIAIFGMGLFAMAALHVIMFITLLVMRFRHAGRVCSGDYSGIFHFYIPNEEPVPPYLHMTGSFLFYMAATHIYIIIGIIIGGTFIHGFNKSR